MAAVRQANHYTVICPTCSEQREISRVAYWHIVSPKGRSSGDCKSCSLRKKTYPGRKNLGNDGVAISARMKGNQWRKGIVDQKHIFELAKINKGNKYAYGIRGEAHHSWKGGIGTERHTAHGRIEYKQWRSAVFLKDNYTCQMCDQYGGYLHADHIKKWAENPGLRYDVNNGRTLCRACHFYITFKRNMPSTSMWGLTRMEQ